MVPAEGPFTVKISEGETDFSDDNRLIIIDNE